MTTLELRFGEHLLERNLLPGASQEARANWYPLTVHGPKVGPVDLYADGEYVRSFAQTPNLLYVARRSDGTIVAHPWDPADEQSPRGHGW